MNTVDKRTIWLKNNYVQQYIISAGRGPMTADAIRVSTALIILSTQNAMSIRRRVEQLRIEYKMYISRFVIYALCR